MKALQLKPVEEIGGGPVLVGPRQSAHEQQRVRDHQAVGELLLGPFPVWSCGQRNFHLEAYCLLADCGEEPAHISLIVLLDHTVLRGAEDKAPASLLCFREEVEDVALAISHMNELARLE